MPISPQSQREQVAGAAWRVVAIATLANLFYDLVGLFTGKRYPLTSFLSKPADNFSDFFGLLSSYPGGGRALVLDHAGLHAILPMKRIVHVVTDPDVTNFHMMPLSTLIDLGLVRLLGWIDPVVLFLAMFAGIVAAWAAIAWRFAESRREAWLWVALGALCYPMLFTIARGNLFAGFTAVLLCAAVLLALKRQAPVLAAVLLALACNFRPNAILFAVPMLVFYWPMRWRFATALGATGLAVLGASLAWSHALYPAYTLATLRTGLSAYYQLYVVQGWGLAFGSSLFGALSTYYGYHPGFDGFALSVSLAILAGGVLARLLDRIDDVLLLFLTAASYCLGSTILGDYHLLVFILVPMAAALLPCPVDPRIERMRRYALLASCLVLAPKNYLFGGPDARPISAQTELNPLMLLTAAAAILALAFLRHRAAAAPGLALA